MLKFEKNFSLTGLNTFKLQSHCHLFTEINTLQDLESLLNSKHQLLDKKILGGGSNIILSEQIPALVLKNNLKKLEINKNLETDANYFLSVGSGENWHQFVCWCLKNQFYGLENLSLIPGTVGAAPIQNIGAYGQEVKNFIHSVKGIHLNSGLEKSLPHSECQFSYRNSIFKTPAYADFFITEVHFKISKKNQLEYSYGELKEFFSTHTPTPELIAEKVIETRTRKLPELNQFPNVGSFFKNPVVDQQKAQKILNQFPQLIHYPYGSDQIKFSAGQLIELCQFKGQAHGPFSMYEKQALVMVNLGGGHFSQVKTLAQKIIDSVRDKFSLELEIEPLIW